MARTSPWLFRVLSVSVTAMLITACGGGTNTPAPQGSSGTGAAPTANPTFDQEAAKKGGTIYILSQSDQWNQVDPQRAYTGEDLAFFGGTIMRSLTAYKFSADPAEGTSLVPDMATDLGTATDGGKTWSFTLRDGVTWQDGADVTCEDIKYGVSRTFATDVINQGPTYAVVYLDIPTEANGSSSYKGPYSKAGQDLYDKAVTCDGKTITFHLNKPIADFNYTVTLGFGAVRKSDDTGETYGTVAPYVISNGPYKIESYTTGNGGKMVLVRNENWNPDSDPYRKAYPDKWEVDFGIDPKVLDQRIMASAGNDAFAVQYGQIQAENLSVIFDDPDHTKAEYGARAISGFDPYSRYYWIDQTKVKNVKIRQAMAVALDRAAIRLNQGGAFAGTFADGLIKPSIGGDYAPTNFWTSYFGQPVPDNGDPELAKKLISESGEAAPTLVFNFPDTPVNQKTAAIVIDSLGKAGITVTPAPLEAGKYYSIVFSDARGDFGTGGWGADWPNASTVLPPLLTKAGGWDLSQLDDPKINAEVDAALTELDRTKQMALWQALNKESAEAVHTIPTFFGLTQTIGGSKVGPLYRWAAFGSWPYGEMYITK
jgi:peptide/nickel transport system substrate-binding protein